MSGIRKRRIRLPKPPHLAQLPAKRPTGEFADSIQCYSRANCHPTTVQRLALRGSIRTRCVRGRVLYHFDDLADVKVAD